jgi:hypothetical protein
MTFKFYMAGSQNHKTCQYLRSVRLFNAVSIFFRDYASDQVICLGWCQTVTAKYLCIVPTHPSFLFCQSRENTRIQQESSLSCSGLRGLASRSVVRNGLRVLYTCYAVFTCFDYGVLSLGPTRASHVHHPTRLT